MLGEYLADRGDVETAATEYRKALRIKPDDAVSLNNLAVQEAAAGRIGEALDLYHRAIAADPNFAPARDNLGNLLVKRGQLQDAIAEYRIAIDADPNYLHAYHNLALTLASEGKLVEAINLWRRAIAIDPFYDDAHASLGNALVMIGQARQGIDEMRAALRLRPDRVDTLNSLAWILATHPTRTFQDGAQAERLARRAVELTHGDEPIPLDTLAAAQARQGQFSEAVETARRAVIVAEKQKRPDLANQISRRRTLYETEKAYTSGGGR
jgi:tetratricopeptide (TPR) repeat protein